MKRFFFIPLVVCLFSPFLFSEVMQFEGNWGVHPLYNIVSESSFGVDLIFSMHEMVIEEKVIEGELMQTFGIPAVFLPRPGVPNLVGACRYVAIPQGSRVRVVIIESRTEVYYNVEVAPAPNIPCEIDDSPLVYEKDMDIYGKDAYWPSSPVKVSSHRQIRGVDVVKVGVIPFQYNPVTKELIIYKDIRFRIEFLGGNGHFGNDRLRSRFWDPLLQGHLLNYRSLPEIDFYSPERMGSRAGWEYIIIVPDDAVFEAWGDTIKAWRKLQGISTEVFTLTEVGGTTWQDIKSFLQTAYTTWDPAPVAFLFLSDYPSSGMDVYGIDTRVFTHPYGYAAYASDNWLADFDGDTLPELYHGRICAQDNSDLDIMVNKFLSYERNPYTSANFYNNPLMACGWQTTRWFQMCIEVCKGFFENTLGKAPAHQYNVYSGSPTPNCAWSSRQGTAPVVAYWNAQGYIPLTNPHDAGYWNNGSAAGINAAINSGAFLLQHRDHGSETGWGEPDYDMNDINNLTNTMFVYVNSTNCLTGRYQWSSECFVERFHRIQYGALGVNGASSVSMSFANDTYLWGMFDSYWPFFDPGYPGSDLPGHTNLRPAPAMTSGKYYHDAMWFPDSAGAGDYRGLTHGLFQHHGGTFMTLYSEIPQNLTVSHPGVLNAGQISFAVTANDSSIIALTVNGEIIGVAEGTGGVVNISIPSQTPPDTMVVTVTKANYYRYEVDVPVISGSSAYIGYLKSIIDDVGGGNGDGEANPGETINLETWVMNFGNQTAQNVYALFTTSNTYANVTQDSAYFGNVAADDSAMGVPDYVFDISANCPDMHTIDFDLSAHDQAGSTWVSTIPITVYAPDICYVTHIVDDAGSSQPNGYLDPGETADLIVTLTNEGHQDGANITGILSTSDTYITINDNSGVYGNIIVGDSIDNSADPFTVTASPSTPQGHTASFTLALSGDNGFVDTTYFDVGVGLPGVPYADHNVGNVIFTVTSQGACGFMNASQSQGSGFIYPYNGANSLYIGSVWLGNAANYVVNTDYEGEGAPGWQVSTSPDGLVRMGGTLYSNQDAWAMYTDNGMSSPKDIYVTQQSWAWANHPYDDFVIMVYTIENKGSSAVNGLYVGQFCDIDVDAYNDYGGVNSGLRLVYVYDPSGIYVGIKLLDPTTASNLLVISNPDYVWPNSYILDSDKIQMLNGSIVNTSGSNDDWSALAAAGPFNINPGECYLAAFAIIGGDDQEDLDTNAVGAQQKYDSLNVGVAMGQEMLPMLYALTHSYPNPARDAVTIKFQTPRKGTVSLRVYDATGRLVGVALDRVLDAGYHSLRLDTKSYVSGVYFYRLEAGGKVFTKKMIVVK